MYLSQCPTNKRPVKKKSSLPFHSRMYPLFLSGLCLEASDSEGLPRTLTRLYADDPPSLYSDSLISVHSDSQARHPAAPHLDLLWGRPGQIFAKSSSSMLRVSANQWLNGWFPLIVCPKTKPHHWRTVYLRTSCREDLKCAVR
jgi:hypothetical protein